MKKSGVIELFLAGMLLISLVSVSLAQNTNPVQLPDTKGVLDESGLHPENINTSIKPYVSQAEIRIEYLNQYTQIISGLLFGVKLKFSWAFFYALVLWLIILYVTFTVLKPILNLSAVIALIVGVIVAIIAMHGFGKNIVTWLDTAVKVWYYSLIALFVGVLILVILSMFSKKFKNYREKLQKQIDLDTLHRNAEIEGGAEKELARGKS